MVAESTGGVGDGTVAGWVEEGEESDAAESTGGVGVGEEGSGFTKSTGGVGVGEGSGFTKSTGGVGDGGWVKSLIHCKTTEERGG
jgi:hypothetical protein